MLMCCRTNACRGDQIYVMLDNGDLLKFTYVPGNLNSDGLRNWVKLGNVSDAEQE